MLLIVCSDGSRGGARGGPFPPLSQGVDDRGGPLSQGLDPALVCSLRTQSQQSGAWGQPSHPRAFPEEMGVWADLIV